MKVILLLFLSIIVLTINAQDYRWQQRVEYKMNVNLNVASHKMTGTQRLTYFNNSPDTLTKVYYHLYFNAFQPNSMMDVRSRNLPDPDRRVADRISKLTDEEIGYHHIQTLTQDGKPVLYNILGTVMEVTLAKSILPKSKTIFEMKFESQVPLQIRRSGRDNKEGIAYSMTQWYPKIAEYDHQGWHADQYVARGEFYGPWGDFDVSMTLDPAFVVAGTGVLQNADKIGFGYEKQGAKVAKATGDLTWHFIAKNVIDFAWAADPDYTHEKIQVPNGPELHFFYQKNEKTTENWKNVKPNVVKIFSYYNERFGKYPFDTYSIIQGGDGGTEYPMCTLILGEGGTLAGITGVLAHEIGHSWFQMELATNEVLYAWMDEGFTEYFGAEAGASVLNSSTSPHTQRYGSYFNWVVSGSQEPASQAADHFNTYRGSTQSAYAVGAIFLHQLSYIIGKQTFDKGMKRYYNTWKMRHPEPNDFIRVMEKTSGLQLQWYLRYWIGTTKTIDYGISSVVDSEGSTSIMLERIGTMPMPIDLVVTYTDGSKELYYISMNELLGNKPMEDSSMRKIDNAPWPWTNPTYTLKILKPVLNITSVEIDPSQRLADINKKNNTWVR